MFCFKITGTDERDDEIREAGTDDDDADEDVDDDDEEDDDDDEDDDEDEEGTITLELTFCILVRRRLNDSTFVC